MSPDPEWHPPPESPGVLSGQLGRRLPSPAARRHAGSCVDQHHPAPSGAL